MTATCSASTVGPSRSSALSTLTSGARAWCTARWKFSVTGTVSGLRSRRIRGSAKPRTISAEPSVHALSSTTSSKSVNVCASTLATVRPT